MNKYKHSGTLGDLVYSMPIMKHFGGGEFYLHLNQIDWIGQHYYGSKPTPFHQGRMTQQDFEFMESFMLAQDYITDFQVMTAQTEITHNLDRFRPAFVGHPGNYVDIYADAFGIRDAQTQSQMRNTAWLSTPNLIKESDRPYVLNRTARWTDPNARAAYDHLREQVESQCMFVGLPDEYTEFLKFSGWSIPYYECRDLLELAQVIGGCEQFIGNQSVALSLAIGLGAAWACESRKDLPLERNECYFLIIPTESTSNMKKLGIIQSRGLGDIVIALPIAHYYHKEGWEVHWPISSEFLPHVENHVPWVHWHTVQTDPGSFFYDQPLEILTKQGCDEILPLYQALTGHKFHEELYFQHTKFDQYKYIRASVPFLNKWQLSECIVRDYNKEQELYTSLMITKPYAVIHLEGSDHLAKFDYTTIPDDWQTITITSDKTPSIFNWLTVLERADSIVCVDSCISNLVDQMMMPNDKYFIPRSHIGLTPVLGQDWTWVKF